MHVKMPEEPSGKLLHFLYHTVVGRIVLRLLTHPLLSKIVGAFLDTRCSSFLIRPYIRKYSIDLSICQQQQYRSFNDFFTRRVRSDCRPFVQNAETLASPCDGKLSVYRIASDSILPVKGREYTVTELLRNTSLAAQFINGFCFVFRLTVDDYHRYFYFDSGKKGANVFLRGRLHTVRPIALETEPVFTENAREYTIINTDHFGTAIQMEVGAMMVGRICNYHQEKQVQRGEEKGKFEFGGSTIILLFQDGMVQPDPELLSNTAHGWESKVLCGEAIGQSTLELHT